MWEFLDGGNSTGVNDLSGSPLASHKSQYPVVKINHLF